MIGHSVRRLEDFRFLTGQACYTRDVQIPGSTPLHALFLRSPYPAARITRLVTERAARVPGVFAVLTAKSLPGHLRPIPLIRKPPTSHDAFPSIPLLADQIVRYQGEPIACIVATTEAVAQDALELIQVEYEPLPAVGQIDAALGSDAPLVHPALETNIAFSATLRNGPVDDAFGKAAVIVRQRMHNNRVVPHPLEPRSVLASYDGKTRQLTVWFSTQRPHHTRWFLSQILDYPENLIRVIMPDVGGAFGCKEPIYPDEVLVCLASMLFQRPVRWTESRSEHFLSTTHGRDQLADLELAADADGRLLGLRGMVWLNIGAYLYPNTSGVVLARTLPLLPGAYDIPAFDVTAHGVFTNTVPTGPYRGAGRPEAIYFIERLIDILAGKLHIDPAEIRRRNFLDLSPEKPTRTITGLSYDSGNFRQILDAALELSSYREHRLRQQSGNSEERLIGIGIAAYVELGGATPSTAAALEGSPPLWESATVTADPTGSIVVRVGTAGHGQGHETTFAQIAASVLGIPLSSIRVEFGDTATAPFGFGTFGTRSMTVGGSAVYLACQQLLQHAIKLAAEMLEANSSDVVYDRGYFYVRGLEDRSVSFQEVCHAAYFSLIPFRAGLQPGLQVTATFDPPNYTFATGVHVAVVAIDRNTGQLDVLSYVGVDDCGRAINPMIVEGQLHGGIAQGIGQALFEHARYSRDGILMNPSLLDYALPRSTHLPTFETHLIEFPSLSNPLGVKGIGEGGAIVGPVAITNAVHDALRYLGITHLDMPHTPEQLWRAIGRGEPGERREE